MTTFFDRAVADKAQDEEAWLRARRVGVTATEVSKLASPGESYALSLIKEKQTGERTFFGNQYTDWGLAREEVLVETVLKPEGFFGSDVLYHAEANPRHLATPDGVYARDGFLMLAEIKTSKYDLDPEGEHFKKTNYYDQMQWQLYVAGDDVTEMLFVWEQHNDQWPTPEVVSVNKAWIDRDQKRIDELIVVADDFLHQLDNGYADDPDDYAELVREHGLLKARIAEYGIRMAEVEDEIRLRIGERAQFAIDTPYGRISYTTPKPSQRFDSSAFKEFQPDMYQLFLKTSQSKPSLRITATKEESSDVF